MKKFRDVLSRWERRELSQLEAAELLGRSERQFRRYRDRFEEDALDGLEDRRTGARPATAIDGGELQRMLGLYRAASDCCAVSFWLTARPSLAWPSVVGLVPDRRRPLRRDWIKSTQNQ